MKLNISKSLAILAAAIMMAAGTACSDDVVKTPLATGSGVLDNSAFNTLTFKWDKIEGATQYVYVLYPTADPEAIVTTDVTNTTSVTFTGLTPSTDYTLKVTPYAALNSNHTAGETFYINARTSDIIVLDTPTATAVQEANDMVFTWDEVAGADSYEYYVLDADGNQFTAGGTKSTTVTVTDLTTGDYTFTIQAIATAPGYASSSVSELQFAFEKRKLELWRNTGTYLNEVLGTEYEATIVAYEDGTYSILGWYGVDGYNLNFSVADDGQVTISDEYPTSGEFNKVPTGTSPANVYVYAPNYYCYFEGDETFGYMYIDVYTSASGYVDDYFEWGTPPVSQDPNYTATLSCWTRITDNWEWEEYTGTFDVHIEIDGNTITLPGLYCDDEYVTGTIDWDALTVTIQPTPDLWGYYTLAGGSSNTAPVVGTISADGSTITFDDWAWWYGTYTYVEDGTVTYTKF